MKWHWTPGGWLRLIVFIALMVGATLLEEKIPEVLFWIMIAAGLAILVYSYLATFINIKKRNKEAEDSDRENAYLIDKAKEVKLGWSADKTKKKPEE